MVLSVKTKKILLSTGLCILAILAVGAFFYARSPYMSNHLKKTILPELSRVSGQRITTERMYVNLFPLFLGVEGLRVSDGDGAEVLSARKARFYVGLLPLLRRELYVPVVTVDGLRSAATLRSAEALAGLIAAGGPQRKGAGWRVKIGAVLLKDASMRLSDPERGLVLSLGKVRAEVNLKRRTLKLKDSEIMFAREEREVIRGTLDLLMSVADGGVRLKGLGFRSGDSSLDLAGEFSDGAFKGSVKADLSVGLLSDIFMLKGKRTGNIAARGSVRWEAGDSGSRPPDSVPAFLDGLSFDLDVEGGLHIETLMELLKQKVPLRGFTGFSGKVKGPALSPVAELDADMKGGYIYGVDVESVKCKVFYEDRTLRFRDGRVSAYNGNASVEVSIQLSRPTRFSLKIEADALDSRDVLRLIKWDPGLPPGSVSGILESEGRRFEPSGTFRFTAFPAGGETESPEGSFVKKIREASGSFRMKERVLTLKDIEASSGRTRLESAGYLDFNNRTLSLKAVASSDEIDEVYYREGVISGTGRFEGTVTGSLDDPVVSGNIRLCNFHYLERPFGCLDAVISYRKRGLEIEGLEGRLNGTTYSAEGTVETAETELFAFKDPVFSIRGTFSRLRIDTLDEWIAVRLPGSDTSGIAAWAEGLLSGSFRVGGPLKALVLKGHAASEELKIRGIDARIETDFRYSGKGVGLTGFFLAKGDSFLKGNLSVLSDGTLKSGDLAVFLVPADISRRLPGEVRLKGRLRLGGTLRAPEGEFDGLFEVAEESRAAAFLSEPGLGRIRLRMENREITMLGGFFRDQVSIAGRMSMDGDLPWNVKVDIREGSYNDAILLFLRDVPEDLFLSLRGEVALSGTRRTIVGSVLLKSLKLNLYGQDFTNTEDLMLKIDGTKVTFGSFSLRTGLAALSVSGDIDLDRGYDLTMSGRAYLSPLEGFIHGLEYIRGYSDFVLAISGDWLDPVVSGGLSIEETSFAVRGIPNRFSSIKGYVYIDENRVVLDTLSGRFASGEVSLKGVAQLKGLRLEYYHLEGIVKDVYLYLQEGVSFKLSGDLVLASKRDGVYLIGDLRVLKGRYSRNIEWRSWILSAKKPPLQKNQYGILDAVELNINLYGDEDIIIDNNVVNAPARIDLVILGTLKSPSLIGRVELKGGKIFFRNNEFTIINASADFTDPMRINPFFEIVARTRVKEYRIHLSLEGYVDQFNLSLTSEPMLDEIDILSLLTVGELGTKLKGFEGGIGASEAASFLTGKLQETIEERLRNITGFDRIQVEPYVSEITGTIGPKVTVSKRLLSDRLYVTYTTSLGNAPEQSLRLEFFLSDNIALVGERDELGTLGADLKFRVEFK